MQEIRIGDDCFQIEPISVEIFSLGEELVFSPFQIKKEMAVYDQVLAMRKKDDTSNQEALMRFILKNGIVLINGNKFNVDEFFDSYTDLIGALELFGKILSLTFNKFSKIKEFTLNQVILIDRQASRYGISPIDIVFPIGGYSECDAYLFNRFIFINSLKNELGNDSK